MSMQDARLSGWVRNLEILITPASRAETLAAIKRQEPGLMPGVLKSLGLKTAPEFVEWLAK